MGCIGSSMSMTHSMTGPRSDTRAWAKASLNAAGLDARKPLSEKVCIALERHRDTVPSGCLLRYACHRAGVRIYVDHLFAPFLALFCPI